MGQWMMGESNSQPSTHSTVDTIKPRIEQIETFGVHKTEESRD